MAIIMKVNTNYKGKWLKKETEIDVKEIPAEVIKRWLNNGIAQKTDDPKKEK